MNDKVSDYTIISNNSYIDKVNKLNKLIYSGRTGKILIINEKDGKLLNENILPSNKDILRDLLKAQIVVPHEEEELRSLVERNLLAAKSSKQLYYSIIPSFFCNMSCSYCGQSHKKGAMPKQHVSATISHIERAIEVNNPEKVFISWL